MTKKYYIFAGNTYYPRGGLKDYLNQIEWPNYSSLDSLASAFALHLSEYDWWHIVDADSFTIVLEKLDV